MVNEFLMGVLSSLAATGLTVTLAVLWSGRFRWLLIRAVSRLTRGDFGQTWPTKVEADEDFRRELARARRVDLLTGRGNELQRDTFAPLLAAAGTTGRQVRLLLPCTGTGQDARWTTDREAELATFDRSHGSGLLHTQIETNVAFVAPYTSAGTIELRRFDAPHIGRVCLTERAAYFTPYSAHEHGRHCAVVKYPVSSPMYRTLERIFAKTWESST
ncbi:hypothetical protein EHYA_09624 [Embleya hyalina]|uniref:Uncharacterized protein n=1 Tax=Embleya hyalina TaxID=516124 RepID=A0A401Z4S6_9ACTN|nr:hypothetical protein EHYA_09624 [Embleya hyalina]